MVMLTFLVYYILLLDYATALSVGRPSWIIGQVMVFCSHTTLLDVLLCNTVLCYVMLFYVISSSIVLFYYLCITPYIKSKFSFTLWRRILAQTFQTHETYQYQLISTKKIQKTQATAPSGAKASTYYCYCNPLSCYLESWVGLRPRLTYYY